MEGKQGQHHAICTLALNEGEWSAACPNCFIPMGTNTQHPLNTSLGELQQHYKPVQLE